MMKKSITPQVRQQLDGLHKKLLHQSWDYSRTDVLLEIQSLADQGYVEAVNTLCFALEALMPNDDEDGLRAAIVSALQSTHRLSAYAGLQRAMDDKYPTVRKQALYAATIIATRDTTVIAGEIETHSEEFLELAQAMALQMIEKAKSDIDREVRRAADECQQAIEEWRKENTDKP